jgi:hypothetical protein
VSRVASTHDDGGLHVDTDSGGHGVEVLDHGEVDPSKLKGGVEEMMQTNVTPFLWNG